jgi:hypothetical protein
VPTRQRLAILERLVVALENASSSLDMSDISPLAWV